jgi:hypothetical protein
VHTSQVPARPGEAREDDDARVYPAPWDLDSTLKPCPFCGFVLLCVSSSRRLAFSVAFGFGRRALLRDL